MLALSMLMSALLGQAPLIVDGACQRFTGWMGGNDPNVKTDLWICRQGNDVCGELTWDAALSGKNVRILSGRLTWRGLQLRDERFQVYAPKEPYRFCLVDRYWL